MDPSVTPTVGVNVTGTVGAQMTIPAPAYNETFSAVDGVTWTSSGGWQQDASDVSSGATATLTAVGQSNAILLDAADSVRLSGGFTPTLGDCPTCKEGPNLPLAYAETDPRFHFDLQPPLSNLANGYAGPSWTTTVDSSGEPLLAPDSGKPYLATFLSWLGPSIDEPGGWHPFNGTDNISNSPLLTDEASASSVTSGSVTLTATLPVGYSGDTVNFVGWNTAGPSQPGTVVATTTAAGDQRVHQLDADTGRKRHLGDSGPARRRWLWRGRSALPIVTERDGIGDSQRVGRAQRTDYHADHSWQRAADGRLRPPQQ